MLLSFCYRNVATRSASSHHRHALGPLCDTGCGVTHATPWYISYGSAVRRIFISWGSITAVCECSAAYVGYAWHSAVIACDDTRHYGTNGNYHPRGESLPAP
ncbi:MAG: hypothetical protein IJB56_06465 [Alistipes sp.]|nr:hypothetical protein [Alistipes sp.]